MDKACLLKKALSLEGLSFRQLAISLNCTIPETPVMRKGWAGQAIERYLGGNASTHAGPDFATLGIELKTLPVNTAGRHSESTFISTIPMLSLHQETWETSTCFAKLRQILWVPIEGKGPVAFSERRIGRAILWSPSLADQQILKQDWLELTNMILLGRLNELHAGFGRYLQVRPKAANGKVLRHAFDEEGSKQLTLPRGFYLRARFTEAAVLSQSAPDVSEP